MLVRVLGRPTVQFRFGVQSELQRTKERLTETGCAAPKKHSTAPRLMQLDPRSLSDPAPYSRMPANRLAGVVNLIGVRQ